VPAAADALAPLPTIPALGRQVVQNAEVLFVAVKPQYVAPVLSEARPYLTDRHVIVSIAAGITVDKVGGGGGRGRGGGMGEGGGKGGA
jgi:pyrroline-5-carboxylate reductase